MKRKFLGIILMLLVFPFSCQNRSQGKEQVQKTGAKELYVFYTGDILGEIDLCGCPKRPMGGVARRAKYIERFFKLKRGVLQLEAGNSFFRYHPRDYQPTDFEKQSALIIAKTCAKLGVDAVNIGAYDLSAGVDFLKELKERTKPWGKLNLISSNLFKKSDQKPVFPQVKIIKRAGLKIGIFGLMSKPMHLTSELFVAEPEQTAEQMVSLLKKEKADLIVGLFNLGLKKSREICREIDGIDLVIVSGYPQYLWEPVIENGCLLVQAGPGGKYLGELKLTLFSERKKAGKDKIQAISNHLERVNVQIKLLEGRGLEDKEIRDKYLALVQEKKELRKSIIELSLKFNFENRLVPLDADLPVDVEVKSWVVELMRKRKKAH